MIQRATAINSVIPAAEVSFLSCGFLVNVFSVLNRDGSVASRRLNSPWRSALDFCWLLFELLNCQIILAASVEKHCLLVLLALFHCLNNMVKTGCVKTL